MAQVLYNGDGVAELLVGRRIVSVEHGEFEYTHPGYGSGYRDKATGRLTLDDGTEILVTPNQGGCSCSAGDYYLTSLAACDNVITSVRTEIEDGKWDAKTYRIYVLADNVEINAVQIDGDDGNGYYGTGYELIVTLPGE